MFILCGRRQRCGNWAALLPGKAASRGRGSLPAWLTARAAPRARENVLRGLCLRRQGSPRQDRRPLNLPGWEASAFFPGPVTSEFCHLIQKDEAAGKPGSHRAPGNSIVCSPSLCMCVCVCVRTYTHVFHTSKQTALGLPRGKAGISWQQADPPGRARGPASSSSQQAPAASPKRAQWLQTHSKSGSWALPLTDTVL